MLHGRVYFVLCDSLLFPDHSFSETTIHDRHRKRSQNDFQCGRCFITRKNVYCKRLNVRTHVHTYETNGMIVLSMRLCKLMWSERCHSKLVKLSQIFETVLFLCASHPITYSRAPSSKTLFKTNPLPKGDRLLAINIGNIFPTCIEPFGSINISE